VLVARWAGRLRLRLRGRRDLHDVPGAAERVDALAVGLTRRRVLGEEVHRQPVRRHLTRRRIDTEVLHTLGALRRAARDTFTIVTVGAVFAAETGVAATATTPRARMTSTTDRGTIRTLRIESPLFFLRWQVLSRVVRARRRSGLPPSRAGALRRVGRTQQPSRSARNLRSIDRTGTGGAS
jgi:hypothetical protein